MELTSLRYVGRREGDSELVGVVVVFLDVPEGGRCVDGWGLRVRDGRVDLLALLQQRCCLPSHVLWAGSFDGSQRMYLTLPELSTKGEKRQRQLSIPC